MKPGETIDTMFVKHREGSWELVGKIVDQKFRESSQNNYEVWLLVYVHSVVQNRLTEYCILTLCLISSRAASMRNQTTLSRLLPVCLVLDGLPFLLASHC